MSRAVLARLAGLLESPNNTRVAVTAKEGTRAAGDPRVLSLKVMGQIKTGQDGLLLLPGGILLLADFVLT